jgi:EamA-like transporter family.
MWFLFAILTALSWGGADLFYKKGSDPDDRYSHLKIIVMVGLVMGLHATAYMLFTGIRFDPFEIIRYLPVSAFYILSMAIGYFGLRYIELSISSPVQNSSGAMTALLLFIFFPQDLKMLDISGVALVTAGVVGLAVLEKRLQNRALKVSGEVTERKYQIGILAITFPILYAILDGAGTFLDGIYLDELNLISEDAALIAYEYTFFLCAISVFWILRSRGIRMNILKEKVRFTAAALETAGQFFYVYAMAERAIIAAPLIASYSIFSVLLSRIFLKEKLSLTHYLIIAVVLLGIALLGIADER